MSKNSELIGAPRRRRLRLSIHQKLTLTIALLVTTVIACLALYFTSQQVAVMTKALRDKAARYGELGAKQAASAVAFSDRETAHEALSSIESDPDVAAMILFGANHQALYTHGEPSRWVSKVGDRDARVVESTGRISALAPVESLEGPRGVLVVQLSTDGLDSARTHARTMALAVGFIALGFGLGIAWLIARRLTRRLSAITEVAVAVAAGDLTRRPVEDSIEDEIGTVSRAFDGMLTQLRRMIVRARHMAKREQDRLEALVIARTVELDRRNAELRLVFDHVDQGFMTVDTDGTIVGEHSRAVEAWLGPILDGVTIWDYIRSFAPDAADWVEMTWRSLTDGILPVDLCLAQLPSRFEVGGRSLVMDFKPLTDELMRLRVLVMIRDVTAETERERFERDERETSTLLAQMFHDPTGFAAFCEEAGRDVATIADTATSALTLRRAVHTLKGTSAMARITSIAELCHDLEDALRVGDEVGGRQHQNSIAVRWELAMSKVAPFVILRGDHPDLGWNDLERLETAIKSGAHRAELAEIVTSWRGERIAPRLERFADQARRLATDLCKGPIDVRLEVDVDLRLPPHQWSSLWSNFGHVLRNAVDHGLETGSQRTAVGKSTVGSIALRARRVEGSIVLELEDDGGGIDWVRVAQAARAHGLPATTPADLQDALFADGLSTREEVSHTSGRGVGLAAFREACESLGGRITIVSTINVGTKLTVTWPEAVLRPHLLQLAG